MEGDYEDGSPCSENHDFEPEYSHFITSDDIWDQLPSDCTTDQISSYDVRDMMKG